MVWLDTAGRAYRNLLYREASFKEPTCAFMAQVVKTQNVDVDIVARPMKSSADRFRVVREDTPDAACDDTLLEDDLPSVVASRVEEGTI